MEKYSKEYHRAHYYLRTNHGKANKCESKECLGVSRNYEWALKKGKEYSFNKDDYLQLCKSCHSKYDFKGVKKLPKETREKMSVARMGKKPGNTGNDSRIDKECKYCKKKYRDYEAKRKTYCSVSCRNLDMINKPSRNKSGKRK